MELGDCYFEEENYSCQDEQIFDFVVIPSFVTLLTGANAEPLYFVKVIDKGIANDTRSDKWGHIISPGTRYFTGHYLKNVRPRNISHNKFNLCLYILLLMNSVSGDKR